MNEHPFTPSQVKDALLSFAEEEFDWDSFGCYLDYSQDTFDVPGLGQVAIKDYSTYDSNKNYDGWSEDLWVIFDIQGTLYRATGSYTSYIGSEWNNELTIVVPKQKVVTYFEEA
jgi:hypothetical protein